MSVHLKNAGRGTLTVLLIEQGRIVLRDGDSVSIEQNARGQFTRVAGVYGPKKIRRRIARQLRRGERRAAKERA